MYITCELNQYREEMLKLLGLSTRDEKARGGLLLYVIVVSFCFVLIKTLLVGYLAREQ